MPQRTEPGKLGHYHLESILRSDEGSVSLS